eukprot:jgi/Galph1/2683/GphlegSOOS_G1335.1
MAGLPLQVCCAVDKELLQTLETKGGIQRLLDFLQVEDLSSLASECGVQRQQLERLSNDLFERFGCTWKSWKDISSEHSKDWSLAPCETLKFPLLEYIKSRTTVEIIGFAGCGKSELIYQIGLHAVNQLPVWLFTSSKIAALSRITSSSLMTKATSCLDHFYIDEFTGVYELCDSLIKLEKGLERNEQSDNNHSQRGVVLIDGMHIFQELNLECNYHERMAWIEFFIFLVKRIANVFNQAVVITNTTDKQGRPLYWSRLSYCPDVHILVQYPSKKDDEEDSTCRRLIVTSRWQSQQEYFVSLSGETSI